MQCLHTNTHARTHARTNTHTHIVFTDSPLQCTFISMHEVTWMTLDSAAIGTSLVQVYRRTTDPSILMTRQLTTTGLIKWSLSIIFKYVLITDVCWSV